MSSRSCRPTRARRPTSPPGWPRPATTWSRSPRSRGSGGSSSGRPGDAAMPAEVVVLGGGVGGTLTANLVSRELGRVAHVTVVDPSGMHVYQPGFLYVALGQANGRWL